MMKTILTGGLLVAAGAAMAMPAAAQDNTWNPQGWNKDGVYIRGQGGWTNLDDNDFNTGAGRIDTKYEDDGWNAGAALGMKKGPMRYEVEALHQQNDVKSQSLNGGALGGAGGEAELDAAMANIYYDFGSGRLKPYIGGGVGAGRVSMNEFTGGGATLMDDEDTVLAYQGMAGVSYELNPCWSVNGEYRYIGTNDAELTTPGGVRNDVAYDSNNVILGLTYKF